MRLIFVMNVFNEATYIEKAISSIHEVADEIWVFDGAYKQYPHNEPYSTDGTLDIARKFPKVKVFECVEDWENQIEKRTAMFKEGQPGDYFFKLDGDEYVANPEIIREHLNGDVGWVWTLANLYDKPIMTARIFKWQEGLHYAGRHHWLYNGKKQFVTSDQYMSPLFKSQQTPIRIFNFRDSSNVKRKKDKSEFLVNRTPDEQQYSREDKVYHRYTRLIAHPHRAPKPRNQTIILGEVESPDYTFSIMVSREWAIRKYLQCLRRLELPEGRIEAVVVIDSDQLRMERKMIEYFKEDERFHGVKIYTTGNKKLPEFEHASFRRQRIVDNWHIILTEMRGKVLLASEDDSLPQPDAYVRLLERMQAEGADFVQGNIIGRWKAKICPAWHIREKDNMPYVVWNAKERPTGFEQIEGCGWYCFVCDADVMRKYQMYVDGLTPLGPDIRFGYTLIKNGYKMIHDWDVKVEHFGEGFSLYPGRDITEQKMWIKTEDGWQIRDFNREFIQNAMSNDE